MEKSGAVQISSSGISLSDLITIPVIVASLGYFVDIYDLILFSIVRVASLKAIGLQGKELLDQGVFPLNMQMAGMLLGGIVWGVLGDKKGRIKILFGSIFLYSVANAANGLVDSIESYAACRFIAPITFSFQFLKGLFGIIQAGIVVAAVCVAISLYALYGLEETFHKDLDYIEE